MRTPPRNKRHTPTSRRPIQQQREAAIAAICNSAKALAQMTDLVSAEDAKRWERDLSIAVPQIQHFRRLLKKENKNGSRSAA